MPAYPIQPVHPGLIAQQCKRLGPLGFILLLHVGFFYILQNGLARQAAMSATPREVMALLIPSSPATEAPAPHVSAMPKTMPLVERAVIPQVPAPTVNRAPAPNAILSPAAPVPPAVSASAEPGPAPATVAPPIASAQPKTIASGVEYIQAPQPEYPAAAKRMGEEGKVVLRVLVNERGRADRVELQKSSGSPRLDEAARQAVSRALFKPYLEDGKALAVYAIVPITFQLD